jgi:hypothetical protein
LKGREKICKRNKEFIMNQETVDAIQAVEEDLEAYLVAVAVDGNSEILFFLIVFLLLFTNFGCGCGCNN